MQIYENVSAPTQVACVGAETFSSGRPAC